MYISAIFLSIKFCLFFFHYIQAAHSKKECFVFDGFEAVSFQNADQFLSLGECFHGFSEVMICFWIV